MHVTIGTPVGRPTQTASTFGADVTFGTPVTFGTVTLITFFYTLDIIPGKCWYI